MNVVGQYVLSVICACILCCVLQLLFCNNSHMAPLMKMVTGLVVSLTVFTPILWTDALRFDTQFDALITNRNIVVNDGERAAEEAMILLIKQQAESYILEKANALGMDIRVEILLSEENPPVPNEVIIKGTVSPYARRQMQAYLLQNFGVSEENQRWIS